MDYQKIKKVHVVYKTHLDIGFTDTGKNVLKHYMEEYIPHSINLAMELNTEENKRFIWTLGSYLIDYYFRHGDEESCRKLESAIQKGYICWHGLPCTTHTELLDKELFQYGLSVGKRLDERFGRQTICAKMTDVPGHSIAIVDDLADAGISFLHIGVNASSKVPEVPGTFVWRHGEKEIIVQYSAQYGAPGYVEGMDEVLEFAHTGDNLGPQSAEAVEAEIARIQALYPNAVVEASTMDAYARKLLEVKDTLPVVEEEIGDTWIHGVGSDPWRISRYRALVGLKNKWTSEGKLTPDCDFYDDFMMNLYLIAEHTWGLDFKKYLGDFRNWTKADFQKAREEDATTLDFLTNRNAQMRAVLDVDIKNYRGGVFTGSYREYEASWAEQREYLGLATACLPEDMKREAEESFAALTPSWEKPEGEHIGLGKNTVIDGWSFQICGNGAISSLKKDGRTWVKDGEIGLFQYEIFDAVDCVNNYYRYNRDFYENGCWSEGDFSKPGLEFVEGLKHRCYGYSVQEIVRKDNQVLIDLTSDEEASEVYGAPRRAQIRYTFEKDRIRCALKWMDKDANKIPEALWFGFRFDVENPNRWRMNKMDTLISPLDVAKGGNRLQHCVEAMEYSGADGRISVRNLHAPLVSVGGRKLYGDYTNIPDMSKGFNFNLFNNKWGTNFSMWCEDDCAFEFEILF